MPTHPIRRALIAVYDKTGIADFARALVDEFGIEIISTGGTAKHLKDAGIPVTMVEEVTGFPELLDGRVKTLHPKIHAGILADRDNPEHMRQLAEHGIQPIDMVVVNLYPFEKTVADPACTFEDAIEMIDIGGPCMLRAAAKNHRHVLAISYMSNYSDILNLIRSAGDVAIGDRQRLAYEAFVATAEYDSWIEGYLGGQLDSESHRKLRLERERKPRWDGEYLKNPPFPCVADWDAQESLRLRYGENPHQAGALYEPIYGEWDGGTDTASLALTKVWQGDMSFNNYLDANAALEICREVARSMSGLVAAVMVKHNNACGVGIAQDDELAYRRAYLGAPAAAFGGVLAVSCVVTRELATAIMESLDRWGKEVGQKAFFLEVWLAPDFQRDAFVAIQERKPWGQRVRLLAVADMLAPPNPIEFDFKKISGGMLVQTRDLLGLNEEQWKVVTKRRPTEFEMSDLRLAWLVAKHTKSNAISICNGGMLIGNGAGQMSRVMSCRIATWLARENGHAEKLAGSAAASDAFFPFADGPNILIDAGVTAIIQPGGSKRDEDVIRACDERGVAMIFTGTRHFKH